MSVYLRNVWYMAGWSSEIGEKLLPRRLVDIPMVLFRRTDGTVAAMLDRCPHRFAPLSLGSRDADQITCGYHGLVFDSNGACVRNPYSDKLPVGAAVRSFPVIERHGAVWVWTGKSADIGDIQPPDFHWADDAHCVSGWLPMKANYEYGTDNLMDLSHIEYVHKGTFAGQGVIFAGKHTVTQEGDTLNSNWWMPDIAAPSMTRGAYDPAMRCDHWLEMRWNAPACMYLQAGATPAGQPRETGIIAHQAHILTPETATTSHYFWSSSVPPALASPEFDRAMHAMFTQAFDTEDKVMIEAAYRNLEGADFWDEKPVFLGVDAGGTRARRLLEKMRRREATALATASPAPSS